MKKPNSPTPPDELLEKHINAMNKILRCKLTPLHNEKYIHWDKLRHLSPPDDLTHEQWWLGIKFARMTQFKELPILNVRDSPFEYMLTDSALSMLHKIDSQASGRIGFSSSVTTEETRDRFIFNSLVEEAITSSQLEGASTTRQNAVDMIRYQRKPKDKSEKMIMNNYIAMNMIREMINQPLTFESLMNLHRVLTEETLDDPTAAGRLQKPGEERVTVVDNASMKVLHNPPPAEKLRERIEAMLKFANETESETFIHPVIRAIILHFWLAYEHPFLDGNGRTARALFYWSMLRHGYWLFEYISISRILKNAPAKYGRSYLETETDDNDLTYFINYQLEVIDQALQDLEKYLERKAKQVKQAEKLLKHSNLNHRELALISHAIRHPGHEYSVKSHQVSHRIAYATSRADLIHLHKLGLLEQRRIGAKTLEFIAPDNLEEIIRGIAIDRFI
ncbi:Fic family protein [Methylomarinum vadi]|uniref:Fic family protein n=1 Tax=Methylomarinum vadi TaxID=438855 RepID=UPI0004DF3BAC|nr:Fic family protein [Methylomarinum vadi]